MKSKPKTFGELLTDCMKEKNISPAELSELTKAPHTSINNLQSGRRNAGPEITASILQELRPEGRMRDDLICSAANQSPALKAGVEVGYWKLAAQSMKIFGEKVLQELDLDPNQLEYFNPIVHEKWQIRCVFRDPRYFIFLGYDHQQDRIQAAWFEYPRRDSAFVPKRATHTWTFRHMKLVHRETIQPIPHVKKYADENRIQIRER